MAKYTQQRGDAKLTFEKGPATNPPEAQAEAMSRDDQTNLISGQNNPAPADPIPNKPPRMRWHTDLRIRAEIRQLELEVVMQLNVRLMRRA